MNNKCLNCKHARYACNEDYIGCVKFWHDNANGDFVAIMDKMSLDTLETGWVKLKVSPKNNSSGTVGEGIITNGVVSFKKDYCCEFYEETK